LFDAIFAYYVIVGTFTVLQLHLDHTIGAYFDYGNHTEKVSAALSELSFRSPLSISIVTTIM
jgi:hypothetical protein